MAEEFQGAGSPKKKAMNYYNYVHPPLLKGDPNDLVLHCLPPPELHLFLGGTNKMFDGLNKVCGEDQAIGWVKANDIVCAACFGGSMEGNQG